MRPLAIISMAVMVLMTVPGCIGLLSVLEKEPGASDLKEGAVRDIREEYILSGDERDPVLGKGMKEVGKITLHDTAFLYVPDTALVRLMEPIDLYDNSTFDIYAKKIEIHANITLHGGSQLKIHKTQESASFLINGSITAYNDSKIDISGISITITQRIHLFGNNSLNMSSTNAELRGAMALKFYSKWNVTAGSNITYNPNTDLGQYEPLIELFGASNVTLQESKIYVNPPNWTEDPNSDKRYNTSFIMTQDMSSVFIYRSHFSCILPGNVIEMFKRVPSGVILATGNSKWTFLESSVYGELNYTQYLEIPVVINNLSTTEYRVVNHDIVFGPGNSSFTKFTRWFWFASQQDGSISIIRCKDMLMAEPGQTFFKPTSGTFYVRDSKLHGEVRTETIALLDVADSEFTFTNTQKGRTEDNQDYAFKIDDRSHGKITNCRFDGNVELGWSSRDDFLGLSAVNMLLEGNELYGNLSLYANTVVTLKNNKLNYSSFKAEGNSTIRLEGQNLTAIDTQEGINERLMEIRENVTINASRSHLQAFKSNTENATIKINLVNGSSIGFVNLAIPNSTAYIRYENSSRIDDIFSSNDTMIFTTYMNPKQDEVPHTIVPAQNVSIKYRLTAKVYLNDTALPNTNIHITAEGLDIPLVSSTSGEISLEYTYRTLTPAGNRTLLGPRGECSIEFFALKGFETFKMDINNDLTFKLYDRDPPTIRSMTHDSGIGTWALKKGITFSSEITDPGVQGLARVIFQYRVDGGSWNNISMTQTRPGHYECSLPSQGMSTIDYRVATWDQVGNTAVSGVGTLENGEKEKWIMIAIGSVATLILITYFAVMVKNQFTVNRYLNNRYNRNLYPNMSRPKEGKH